jgi:DNA-3-methyladenine glycosylase
VEVEAYLGEGQDEASHAHRGPTPRNEQMFATPGHLHVYVSYGLHHCLNVVCEDPGTAGAVLLRAAEPLEGESQMRRRRGRSGLDLSNGPGKLGQCLDADLGWNGRDLVEGELGLWPGTAPREIGVSSRIGISRDVERPLRFFDTDSPYVSRGTRVRVFDEGHRG